MGEKNYNPFKMWGSYVGAGIIGITIFFSFKIFLYYAMIIRLAVSFLSDSFYVNHFIGLENNILLQIEIGFLIGWGIHSIFRRFKK